MIVWAAALDGAHGGNCHACIAEPIRRSNEGAERLEIGEGHRCGSRESDTAFVLPQQKVRLRGLPPAVNPEPISGRCYNHFLSAHVQIGCKNRQFRCFWCFHRLAEFHLPAGDANRGNCDRDGRHSSPLCDDSRKVASGYEAPEKWPPDAFIARVLVDENSEKTACSENLYRTAKSIVPINSLCALTLPEIADVAV